MKTLYALIISVFLAQFVHAQGIGVNETGADPHPSAMLDVNSHSKGLLPPRMTTAERDDIQDPAEGLQIYNTTTKCFEAFYGTFWQSMHCGCSVAPSNLVYSDNGPITYCLNQSVALNSPATQDGNPSSYTVSPPLPAGLFLNTTTGQVTGSPATEIAASNFTFSASNACGSTTRVLTIGVIAIPSVPSMIEGPSAPTINTSANYSIEPVSGASSYTWTVPVGWTINSGQGTTSVDVTIGENSGNISATASNTCGTSSASVKPISVWRPVVATGGTITNYTADGTNGINGVQYRVHSFTTVGSSTFNSTDTGTDGLVDYLVVAGGGGGGGTTGGGGGAGGVLVGFNAFIDNPLTSISVGGGGLGQANSTGQNGGNSSLGNIVSTGGGGGARNTMGPSGQPQGYSVGSGGSGGGGSEGLAGGSGVAGQGYSGGTATYWISSTYYGAGGGGGAGAPGSDGTSLAGGSGGIGIQSSITGSLLNYSGGGGGGTYLGGSLGIGGSGGGGSAPAGNGQPNTGGGGGGQIDNNTSSPGGSGGSGIVIIRYPITNPNL